MRRTTKSAISVDIPAGVRDVAELTTLVNDRLRTMAGQIQTSQAAAEQAQAIAANPAEVTDPGTSSNVAATTTATVWYKNVPGQGFVFGFEGVVVPPADVTNYGGCRVYLHWAGDTRYLAIYDVPKAGGAWHANEPGWPLQQNFVQAVDVIFVPKNAIGLENSNKDTCVKVTLIVQWSERDGYTPPTAQQFSARTVYDYDAVSGWKYSFAGTIAEPADTSNYSGTTVYVKWDGEGHGYAEVGYCPRGTTSWQSPRPGTPLPPAPYHQGLAFYFLERDAAGHPKLADWSQAFHLPGAIDAQSGGGVAGDPGREWAELVTVAPSKVSIETAVHDGRWQWRVTAPQGSGAVTLPNDPKFRGWQSRMQYPNLPLSAIVNVEALGSTRINCGWYDWPTAEGDTWHLLLWFMSTDSGGNVNTTVPGVTPCMDLVITRGVGAPNVNLFSIGTAKEDGTFDPKPAWDTLNERMVFEWGCLLPPDVSNLGGVSVFIHLPDGSWVQAPRSSEWVKPQSGAAYYDSFTIAGDAVPKTPESWAFVACSANKDGAYNKDGSGNPVGPSRTLSTIAPNGGIGGRNIDPNALGDRIALNDNVVDLSTTTPDNMLGNPDFELGLKAWNTTGAVTVQTATAYTGSGAAKFSTPGAQLVAHWFSVRPLDNLTFDCWYKCDAGTNGGLVLTLRGANAAHSASTTHVTQTFAATTTWTRAKVVVQIAANSPYTQIEAIISCSGAYTTGAYYIDNACLRREPSLGSGLSYDSTGNLVIPATGITRTMLQDQIVDTGKLADAQIVKNTHIIRAGVDRLLVLDADIDTLSANKITAGTLAAGVIYAGTINCGQINAGTLNAVNLIGGTLTLNTGGYTTVIDNGVRTFNGWGSAVGFEMRETSAPDNSIILRPQQLWMARGGNTWVEAFVQADASEARFGLRAPNAAIVRMVSNSTSGAGVTVDWGGPIGGSTPVFLEVVGDAGKFGLIYDATGYRLRIGTTKLVGARQTGWGAPTGTLTRSAFASDSVTLQELARRVAALVTDLRTHGLIGD